MQLSKLDQFINTLDDTELDSFIDIYADDYSKHDTKCELFGDSYADAIMADLGLSSDAALFGIIN